MCFNGVCLFSELCLIFRLASVRPEGKNVLILKSTMFSDMTLSFYFFNVLRVLLRSFTNFVNWIRTFILFLMVPELVHGLFLYIVRLALYFSQIKCWVL